MSMSRIMLAVPCRWQGGYRAVDIVIAQVLKQYPGADVRYGMTGVLPGARNRLVRMALDEKWDYIWWLDDDQPFNPDDLGKLLAHGVDAVVPLSPRRGTPFLPLLYDGEEQGQFRQHFLDPADRGLIKVFGAGMAGLLIRTSCFRDMGTDGWFEFEHPPGNFDDYAEDLPFYRKLAAQGVQLYCDLGVSFGHILNCVAYIGRQGKQWVTILAESQPFVAFPQPEHPLLAGVNQGGSIRHA